ncbi:MAG: hypothetical protein ACLU80_17480 [Dorea sp.]
MLRPRITTHREYLTPGEPYAQTILGGYGRIPGVWDAVDQLYRRPKLF